MQDGPIPADGAPAQRQQRPDEGDASTSHAACVMVPCLTTLPLVQRAHSETVYHSSDRARVVGQARLAAA